MTKQLTLAAEHTHKKCKYKILSPAHTTKYKWTRNKFAVTEMYTQSYNSAWRNDGNIEQRFALVAATKLETFLRLDKNCYGCGNSNINERLEREAENIVFIIIYI